jgi:hypothetical protein
MAQEIMTLTAPDVVEAKVRAFIFTDTDGSQRVDEAGLTKYLTEQFGYLTVSGASPTTKQAQAAAIANTLQGTIGRENWASYPDYPKNTTGDSESVKTRLVDLRVQMNREVVNMTNLYRPYEASLATRVKALFNQLVLPAFPAGIERVETTRAYIETFVTDWGEESRPGPVSALATLDQNDTANVKGTQPPGGRNVVSRRIYRSASGSTTSAFRLLGEYPIAQGTVLDDKGDDQLNEACPTFGWLEPPAGLQGLIGMANGIMLGFDGSTLWACEPYKPYAYPEKYRKPLPHQIVGMVALDQSAFVGTVKFPYLVTGADSASLSEQKINDLVPCAAARSMVAVSGAVFYASTDGLALYENGGVSIVSEGIDRKTWQSYNPASMRAAGFDGRYIVFYTKTDGSRGALVFDYKAHALAELAQSADAVFANQDGIYVLDGGTLFDLIPAAGAPRTGRWYTKTLRLTKPEAFGWIHVDSEGLAASPATLRIYAGGVLHDAVVVSSAAPIRCKPGRHTDWRIEIESAATINGVTLATTTAELKAAP